MATGVDAERRLIVSGTESSLQAAASSSRAVSEQVGADRAAASSSVERAPSQPAISASTARRDRKALDLMPEGSPRHGGEATESEGR